MALFGYARVSTADQDHEIQVEALKAAGCEIIRAEKMSGTSREGRAELENLLQFIRAGDTLVVTRIDRLARSLRDLQNILHELRMKGAFLRALEQGVNTADPASKAFIDMLGVFAEFETNLRRQRQMEGIRKAKERGGYAGKGRKPRIKEAARADIVERYARGEGTTEIGNIYRVNRTTVYRALRAAGVTFTNNGPSRDDGGETCQGA